MGKVAITIDGQRIMAKAGANLLAEAVSCGFDIPHLCYDSRLKPFGACRLCFVEVEGKSQPIPACSLTVTEGLEIITNSEQLRQLRKTALELLMAEHCGDCLAPCTLACPAGVDIQGFIAFINNGDFERAAYLIREKMPLPSICGRVCPRFCEKECRRSLVDQPLDICGLKRYVGDYWLEKLRTERPMVSVKTDYRIAIVGGGPAGLTAAYYLALQGHQVTIYEASSYLGGMLRYGIPEYRLPERILDQEIQVITDLCQAVRLNQSLGKDFTLPELKANYDAIFLGIGCQEGQTLGLEQPDLAGVYSGVDFLRQVTMKEPVVLGEKVAVVGGGNTAMDAARTAIRLGAKEVMVLYRRSQAEMPAEPIEVQEAMEEGVQFHFLTNIKAIYGKKRIKQIQCIKMELTEPDESGRCKVREVPQSEFLLDVDTLIMAIGQKVESNILPETINSTSWGTVITDEFGQTSEPGIFAAGDCVSGAATVVEAVGKAREVAENIDRYLRGGLSQKVPIVNSSTGSLSEQNLADYQKIVKQPRIQPRHLSVKERISNFQEYSLGFTADQAQQEASRCLECGCLVVHDCALRELATEYQVDLTLLGQSKKRYELDNSHPLVIRDQNKCILCGKCVQLCGEVTTASSIGFIDRGYDTVIGSVPGLPLDDTCYSCGQCVASCPTGALSVRYPWVKLGPWKIERVVETTCLQCNIGCALEMHIVGDKIVNIVGQEVLCKKGGFNYDFLYNKNRILRPHIKKERQLVTASWEQAFSLVVKALGQIKDAYGGNSIAVLASPLLTNEEQYLVQRFARLALGTNNLSSTRSIKLAPQKQAAKLEDIRDADYLIMYVADYARNYPLLARRVKQCIEQGGTLIKVEQFQQIVEMVNQLEKGHDVVVVADGEQLTTAETKLLTSLVCTFSEDYNLKLLLLSQDGNSYGQQLMGVHPNFLPGYYLLSTPRNQQLFAGYYGKVLPVKPGLNRSQILAGLQSGQLKGLVVVGDDLEWHKNLLHPDVFAIAIAANWQDHFQDFSVILPGTTFLETNGTALNVEGRLQKVHQVIPAKGDKSNWRIIADLMNAFGVNYQVADINDIVKEIVSIVNSLVTKPSRTVLSKLLEG